MNNGLNLIQENVNLLIKTKLNEITASTTPSNESQVSYAAILGKNGNGGTTTKDSREIMLATKMKRWLRKQTENEG